MTMQWQSGGNFPAQYEDVNVAAFFRVFAQDLVDRLALTPADRLLDIATGTGIVVRTARERVPDLARVVGLDLSPAMLEVARERCGDDIELLEGDATELPFGDGEFTVLTCQQGLQFVPDRPAALAEFRRVTSGGGRIALACWRSLDHQIAASAIADAAEDLVPDMAAAGGAPFALDRDALAELVRGAGFEDVDVAEVTLDSRYASAQELVDGFATGTPLALVIPSQDPEKVAAWREKAIAILQPHETADGLVLPMTTTLVTARSS
jgi:trans-aconitate methyltransferase